MPRKTRKQKERASQRRSVYSERSRTVYTESDRSVNREFNFRLADLQTSSFKAKNGKSYDKSSTYVSNAVPTRDLLKSILLAGLIFSLELVIYWARLR